MDPKSDQLIVLDEVQEVPQGKVLQWGHWYMIEEPPLAAGSGPWLSVCTNQVHMKLADCGMFYFQINGEERKGWGKYELKEPPLRCNLQDTLSLIQRRTKSIPTTPVFSRPSPNFTLTWEDWCLTSPKEGELVLSSIRHANQDNIMLKISSHDLHITSWGEKYTFFVQ